MHRSHGLHESTSQTRRIQKDRLQPNQITHSTKRNLDAILVRSDSKFLTSDRNFEITSHDYFG